MNAEKMINHVHNLWRTAILGKVPVARLLSRHFEDLKFACTTSTHNMAGSGLTEEIVDVLIERMLALNRPDGIEYAQQLHRLKPQLLATDRCGVIKEAENFTLDEVVEKFELNYREVVSPANIELHCWRIEESKLDFSVSPSLGNLPRLLTVQYNSYYPATASLIPETSIVRVKRPAELL